ncbi:hypothetical protein OSTOST_15337 [Ostertagia ostertagi]
MMRRHQYDDKVDVKERSVATLLYVLVLQVIVRKQYRRLSCYKIMLVLGVQDVTVVIVTTSIGTVCFHPLLDRRAVGRKEGFVGATGRFKKVTPKATYSRGLYDMCAIGVNSLLTGYFWLIGANYCLMPLLMYVTGAAGLGLWCGACMICFVLVINRLLDLWDKHTMQMLFKDARTYVILLIPFCYSLYFTLFTPPLLFNSDHTAWFFSSFADNHNIDEFFNYPHTTNNLLIVVLTCLLYVQYSRLLLRHSKVGAGLSWAQKSFFLQSSSICMANLIAALIYVYMQFFPTPSYFVLVGHICWQLGHGFPAFVYLLLNRTIQREALLFLGFRKRQIIVRPSIAVASKTVVATDG